MKVDGGKYAELDWFDLFWARKDIVMSDIYTSDQLMLASAKLKQDTESFWKFKCSQVLKLMALHLKRRARLLLAFGFQHYKYQV